MDEFLNIETPENVVFDFEVVGIGSRFLSTLVDTAIILAVQVISLLPMWLALEGMDEMSGAVVAGILGFIGFVLFWGYYILFEMSMNGQTPGKRMASIRVIRRDGMPITLTDSIIRNLVRLVDFLPVMYGIGVVVMFIDGQSRRLGDMAAGTLVVRERDEVTLEGLRNDISPALVMQLRPELHEQMQSWPFERLGSEDIRLAEEFLRRRGELVSAEAIGASIWARWAVKLDQSVDVVKGSDMVAVLAYGVRRQRRSDGSMGG